ncbi:guanine nucleotide-binding protein-like 3-like protein [Petromyzon marinus]|uniref:guanine nucleotide-binding protein-like 3-like protein n=1 Tax=Petromyzon marinus TaxID=7757 RepID=UPI003F72FA20
MTRKQKKGGKHVANHKRLRIAKHLGAVSGSDGTTLAGPKKGGALPNIGSFKEHVKRSQEQREKRIEERKRKQQESREKEQQKRRSLESFQKDVQQRQRAFDSKEVTLRSLESSCFLESDGSRKAYYREFRKVVEAADVVLEVLDARDPLGCRCPQVEQAVMEGGTGKRIVLVLSKIDLVPKDVVEKWLKYLRNEFPTVAFKSSTQQQSRNLHRSRVPLGRATADLLGSSACVGAEGLMRLLGNYCRNRDIRTSISVGVVGFPNVGKSSLINSLKRSRACTVGATPGVTKCVQEVHLDKHVRLLDSPGIVMAAATSGAALILRNCIKVEQLVDAVGPVDEILKRCSKTQIMQHYGVGNFRDSREFLCQLARRQGRLKRGAVPDHEQAAKAVLTDWTSGRISYYTHPPEQHTMPTHISATIVAEMGAAFDLAALEREDDAVLAGLQAEAEPGTWCVTSGGVTAGASSHEALANMDGEEEVAVEEEVEEEVAAAAEGMGADGVDDGGDDDEEEEEEEEQEETMDDGLNSELGPMTVEIRARRKGGARPRDTKEEEAQMSLRRVDLAQIRAVPPLQQGHALRAAAKRHKKIQKRADKLSSKLSDKLTEAMNFL